MNKKTTAILIFALGAVAGIAGFYLFQGQKSLSAQEAGKVAIDFINKSIEENNVMADLLGVIEESGVYKMRLKIENQEYDSFITRDGKYLFSSAFILEENPSSSPDQASLENFAKCLTDQGAKFYGAYYCSWCKKEKDLFGESAQYLPYIECVDEKTQETFPACKEANITSFPTWEFNGEKTSGFKTLEQLSELSGCQL